MVSMQKLLFWLDKRYNVLLEGKHGVGKTAVILEAFNKAGLRWAYFSGSTMDPFIDFVGVPIKIDTADGSYIELIRPKNIVDGDIQAIFIDEFNRSHKKIRNAVMELIQFKTINQKKISSDLRVVWAAINPDSSDGDGIYDTDRLDPALRDRFEVQIQIPYQCDKAYFTSVYTEGVAKSAIQWWEDLPPEEKDKVSPRRLDYALKLWKDNGDVRDVLPTTTNPSRLVKILSTGPAEFKLKSLLSSPIEAKKFLQDANNYDYSIKTILANSGFMEYYIPLMPQERISALYTTENKVKSVILENVKKNGKESPFVPSLIEIAQANQNEKVSAQIREELEKSGIIASPCQIRVFYFKNVTANIAELQALLAEPTPQTYNRKRVYEKMTKQVSDKLTTEAAGIILAICDKLSRSTRKVADRNMPKIIQIENHAILNLLKNGQSAETIEKTIKQLKRLSRDRKRASAPSIQDCARFVRTQNQVESAVQTPF